MNATTRPSIRQRWMVAWAMAASLALGPADRCRANPPAAAHPSTECDLARKADILNGPQWKRATGELAGWLATQTVYTPAEVRRIKVRFDEQVAGMSSYDLEYLLASIDQKMQLLNTPQARDAKAWLGEYLSAMSDGRRAQELRKLPNLLEMDAAQLWAEIQRIDRMRTTLQQRHQGVPARQNVLANSVSAGNQASAAAARAASARVRSAPAHSPYRQGGGSPPFSDVKPRRMTIGVGPMGVFIGL